MEPRTEFTKGVNVVSQNVVYSREIQLSFESKLEGVAEVGGKNQGPRLAHTAIRAVIYLCGTHCCNPRRQCLKTGKAISPKIRKTLGKKGKR